MKKTIVLFILLPVILVLFFVAGAVAEEKCLDQKITKSFCIYDGEEPGEDEYNFVCIDGDDNYSLPEDYDGDGSIECDEDETEVPIETLEEALDFAMELLPFPECPKIPNCLSGYKETNYTTTEECIIMTLKRRCYTWPFPEKNKNKDKCCPEMR